MFTVKCLHDKPCLLQSVHLRTLSHQTFLWEVFLSPQKYCKVHYLLLPDLESFCFSFVDKHLTIAPPSLTEAAGASEETKMSKDSKNQHIGYNNLASLVILLWLFY